MICKLFDAKLLQISRLGRGKPNVGNNIFRNDIHLLFVFQVLVFCPVLEPLEFDAKLEIYRLTSLVNVDDPQQGEGDVDTDALNVPFVQVAEADRGDFHVVSRTQDNQLAISLVRLREALLREKMFSFGHCPKRGGGDPCPNLLTLFSTMFSLIF